MPETYPEIITLRDGQWHNLASFYPAASDGRSWVENKGDVPVFVAYSSDAAPPAAGGYPLEPGQRLSGQAPFIWAQAPRGDALLGIGLQEAGATTLTEGSAHIGSVGGHTIRSSATFSRPADTTAYAAGDIVANAAAAGAVVPMTFNIGRGSYGLGGMVRRARLRKTGTNIANATFRLHLYASAPVPSNGDNGAWLTSGAASYVGSIDITCDKAFTDGAAGNGVPTVGGEINYTADIYYGVLEARGAYAPANGETFTVTLETLQN